MKFAITSDTHLASRYPFSTDAHPLKDVFFRTSYSGISQVIKYAEDHRCPILHGADWFDSEIARSPELHATTMLFSRIQQRGIPMFINLGNHEIDYKEGIPSVLRSVCNPFLPIIQTPEINQEWDVKKCEDLNIYMIPYCPEKIFMDRLKRLCQSKIKKPAILMIHQNMKGIPLGKVRSMEGMGEKEIAAIVKENFKLLICGHLHFGRQSSQYGMNIVIPGSTCGIDFKDVGSRKVFYVAEFNDSYDLTSCNPVLIKNQITFIECQIDAAEAFAQKDKRMDNVFLKVHSPVDKDCSFIEKRFMELGAVGVVIDRKKKNVEPDLSSYDRPLHMSTDDWLRKHLVDKIYDEEEREGILEMHSSIEWGKK